MTDGKRDPADVLARARRAWSPNEADAGRVRRAIGSALATSPASGGAAAQPGPPGSASALTWTSRFLVAGAIAATSGSVGYWAGHRAGLRDTRPTTPVIALAPTSAASVKPKSPAVPSPAAETPPLAGPSLVPSRHDAHGARRASDDRTLSQSKSLELEVRALRNAERALRDGNPGLALAFLQELDRQVPNGQLIEERDAASTLARCARGDHPFGVNQAAEFTERHPGSVYRARIEQACAATDSPASGDSSPRRSGP
ncbi:MAG TPA: hypothetical protein VLC06_24345 [Polyangia bacterium]|jgi:hypothetical protein|nr:hypothetical protein [Polyangia bacterium]